MMKGRLAALSSNYDICLVPNFTNMHYRSLNSHRHMLYHDINWGGKVFLVLRKTTFQLTFFELGYLI